MVFGSTGADIQCVLIDKRPLSTLMNSTRSMFWLALALASNHKTAIGARRASMLSLILNELSPPGGSGFIFVTVAGTRLHLT